MQSRRPAVQQLAHLLQPRHSYGVALDRRSVRAAISNSAGPTTPPTLRLAVMEFENARAPGALRANEETPRAAVAKFAMHDAHFASEHALAFAETDDYPRRVGGYRPTCAQLRDALTCREVVVKTPVLTHGSYVATRDTQFLLGVE